jgi:hypothetical protein
MDRLNKARGIASKVTGPAAKATEAVAAPAVAKSVAPAVEEVAQKAFSWRDAVAKGAPKAPFLGKGKILSTFKVGSDRSLTEIAAELYSSGAVRPTVMEHAVKQAAHIKSESELHNSIKTAEMRRDLFGASSPTLEKVAGIFDAAKPFNPIEAAGSAAMATAGGALAGAGLMAVDRAVNWIFNTQERDVENSYRKMMEANPDFAGKAAIVREHFDVLKQFAPSVASNPTAAAGHVRQAIEMGNMIPVDTVRNLVQTEKLHSDIKGGSIFPGWQ